MAKVYLISEKTLKSNSVINDNVDTMYLLPAIEYAQDAGLQPLIGSKLFRTLQNMVADGSIQENEKYKLLLDDYIAPYLTNKVIADIQLPLAYKVRNQGVIQQTSDYSYVPTLRDAEQVKQDYENKATFYGNRLSDYLRANKNDYPEYCQTDSCADMHANKHSYNTGIYLGK